MYSYKTKRVCSRRIDYDVKDGKLTNVKFIGGCDGNLKGISTLVEGMDVDKVIEKLDGITCELRKSSCPDQLAKAMIEYKENIEQCERNIDCR